MWLLRNHWESWGCQWRYMARITMLKLPKCRWDTKEAYQKLFMDDGRGPGGTWQSNRYDHGFQNRPNIDTRTSTAIFQWDQIRGIKEPETTVSDESIMSDTWYWDIISKINFWWNRCKKFLPGAHMMHAGDSFGVLQNELSNEKLLGKSSMNFWGGIWGMKFWEVL